MRKYWEFLFVLFFICCEGIVKGQSADSSISSLVDSFDQVKPMKQQIVRPVGKAFTIKIATQGDFDKLNSSISDAINAGKRNIRIIIGNGTFHYRENHLLRRDERHPRVSITIEGKKRTLLTSDEGALSVEKVIPNAWQEMKYADEQIEVVDEGKKLCRIPFSNSLTLEERISKVQVTEWFRAPVYDVEKIDGNEICFVASDLQTVNINGRKGYNVNYDFLYRQMKPRFRLYDGSRERRCCAARWLCLERCSYKLVCLKNLHFVSNKAGGPLMTLGDVKAESISFIGCSFEYIRGTVLSASATENIIFDKDIVRHTAGDELRFLSNCENVRVTNNLFENNGENISNSFCVNCREATYYIAHNTFRDFGYGAIGVGVWHGFEKKCPSRGIIEHNEIYFSPEYFSNAWQHMLMDSGAIYTWTQNDQVIIRYNYIHDYTGAGDNRGMFCDDGANNLKIYRNVVTNIQNSYCIDSRYGKDQREGFTNNANNFMAQNVVDGRVRFQGYSGEIRHVVKGANYVVKGEKTIENKTENLEVNVEDVEVREVKDVQKFKEFKKFKLKVKN